MGAALPQAALEEIQAVNQWPTGHLSKDHRAWKQLPENTAEQSGAPGSRPRSGLARGCKDPSEALRQSALW